MKTKFNLIILLLSICSFTNAQIKLPKLISNGMVLQQGQKIKIWGWASANEKIELSFNKNKYNAIADEKGNWQIELPAQKPGGPHQFIFKGNNEITVNNILFGDVWVCSGQSNMELPMDRVKDKYANEIANSTNDNIRQFLVPQKYNFKEPDKDFDWGNWQPVTPINVLKFTAVGYFFAKDLYEKYHVPIGLINNALGGSPAEAWLSEDALKQFPNYYDEALKFRDDDLIKKIDSNDNAISKNWNNKLNENDEGLKADWKNPNLNEADWNDMNIPGYWADNGLGKTNGVVWFRKKINVPSNMVGKPAKLLLGRIVDADSTFINGQFVGNVTYLYPPRRYEFLANILKPGENEITVRVVNNSGSGGFVLDKPYKLIIGKDSIDLTGKWKYKLGAKIDPLPGQTFIRWKPLGLYNAMLAPILNYSIKGVIWFQGEANVKNPTEYKQLFPAMINNWRSKFNQGDFPFLFVQLANFQETKNTPTESAWAELRQAQTEALKLPKTGMAVTIDVGEWNDIHPLDKYDVGHRLALQAEHVAYGDNKIVYSGPLFKSSKILGNKIELSFTDIGSGLIAKNGKELKYFSITGADKKYVWAKAEIKNNKVIVWNDAITNPVSVRYAWADNPEGANLYNKEDLPASPFEATVK